MTPGQAPARPRFAATVVLLRDGAGDGGVEVLMLRRHAAIEFAGAAWVFPGGAVDEADRTLPPSCWRGIDPVALSERFGAPQDLVIGFHVAAVRELFEEAGLLLGRHRSGQAVDLSSPDVTALRAAAARRGGAAPGAFSGWLRSADVVLDLATLVYLSRWVTPKAMPKRFDAAFFVARAPLGQVADHDRVEATARRWVRPPGALAEQAAGTMPMMHPTVRTLELLATYTRAGEVIDAALARSEITPVEPRVEQGPDGPRIVDDLAPGDGGRVVE